MSELKIFYSWQSDLPNSTNRRFIEDCLEKAAREIKNEGELSVDPVVDRDTQGIAGTPNIIDTILKKIDSAAVIVFDITIINDRSRFRSTPNPNVMLELGYALGTKGWDRIVMVINESFGKAERLPFDLPWRRALTYSLAQGADKTDSKLILQSKLKAALTQILGLRNETIKEAGEDPISRLSKADALARQQAFQEKQSAWKASHQGVADTEDAAKAVFTEIEGLFEADRSSNDAIGNSIESIPERNIFSLVYRGMMAINLHWRTQYGNSVDHSGLYAEVRNLGERQDRNRKRTYRSRLAEDGAVNWFDEKEPAKAFTNSELAAWLYDEFLDEIELVTRNKN